MRCAIDFDNQASLDVCEIGYERPDWMLPPEVIAMTVGFLQALPKNDFGLRHTVTKRTSEGP